MWHINGKLKERGVNQLLLMQVNEDSEHVSINHIKLIWMKILPIWNKNKE